IVNVLHVMYRKYATRLLLKCGITLGCTAGSGPRCAGPRHSTVGCGQTGTGRRIPKCGMPGGGVRTCGSHNGLPKGRRHGYCLPEQFVLRRVNHVPEGVSFATFYLVRPESKSWRRGVKEVIGSR